MMVLLDRAMVWYVPTDCEYKPPLYLTPLGVPTGHERTDRQTELV